MSTVTRKIGYNSGTQTATFEDTANIPLQDQEDLQVELDVSAGNFSAGAKILKVTIYEDSGAPSEEHGDEVCSWNRVTTNTPATCQCNGTPIYQFTSGGETEVTIEDVENPTADDKYWLQVSGEDSSGRPWATDPELINKPT